MQKKKLRYILTITLSCLLTIVIAQQRTVSGTVLDKTTNEPIPYASIYLASMKNGIYSFENGSFKLNYDTPDDTVVISAIGYITFKDRAANLKANDNTILLEPSVVALDEVVVTPGRKAIKKILGKFDLFTNYSICFSDRELDTLQSFGYEYIHFMTGINKPVKVNRVFVKCRKEDERFETIFMLRFYVKEEGNRIPGKLINKEPIVRSFKKTTAGALVFDIENEGIILPSEGLFVSFEHIGYKAGANTAELIKEYYMHQSSCEGVFLCRMTKDNNYLLYRFYRNNESLYYMFTEDDVPEKWSAFSDGNGKKKWKMSVKFEITEMR